MIVPRHPLPELSDAEKARRLDQKYAEERQKISHDIRVLSRRLGKLSVVFRHEGNPDLKKRLNNLKRQCRTAGIDPNPNRTTNS